MVVEGGLLLGKSSTVTLGFSVASLGFGSALVGALAARPGSIPTRVLTSRVLRTFGKYSYGLYVVHLPIVLILMAPPGGYFDLPGTVAYLLHLAVVVGLSFAAALVSWHLIELPFLNLKSGFRIGSASEAS
jgi:peptidoglycan/LPS O-acetylase OafA/YrhL